MDPMVTKLETIFQKVKKRSVDKVNIFGGGIFGRRVIDKITKSGVEIGYIYDSTPSMLNNFYKGIEYKSPNEINSDYPIVVCSMESNSEMVNFIEMKQIDRTNIIAL
jgi:hypothetical protein